MKIVRSRYLPPSRRHVAINLFGVFFVHPNVHVNERIVNHERIHTAQMRELCYIPFYLIYLTEWLIRLMMKGNAYMSISFEREAYRHEFEYDYLKHRKHYAWVKFIKKKNKKYRKRKKKHKLQRNNYNG
jgi:hypothetical protein